MAKANKRIAEDGSTRIVLELSMIEALFIANHMGSVNGLDGPRLTTDAIYHELQRLLENVDRFEDAEQLVQAIFKDGGETQITEGANAYFNELKSIYEKAKD